MRFFDGTPGTKISYTHNTTQFTTNNGTSFPIATTVDLLFDGKTVSQLEGLIKWDPEVLTTANAELKLEEIGLTCKE